MQSVNREQLLNITFLVLLLGSAPSAAVFSTVIVPLISMYAFVFLFFQASKVEKLPCFDSER